MKMTPEQKAVYEYGKARGILKERKELMLSMEGEFDGAVFYPEYRELYRIDKAIRDAWQRRAACRAWVPLERRRSKTCRYRDESPDFETCDNCTQGIFINDFCNWEPRKEGK